MELIERNGKYFLYKNENTGLFELWHGKYGDEYSYRAGYVADLMNLNYAIDVAEEEMRCTEAEVEAEFATYKSTYASGGDADDSKPTPNGY
jgi:hypothetical protein